jgi:uncharacterized protein YecE (DUF72 family)
MAELRVGCSGYHYAHWRGVFYPEKLPTRLWFDHYARHFDTVELNATFYRLPEEQTVRGWRDRAPAGFVYAVKLSRYGTHVRRLRDPEAWVGRFLERARLLGPTLGPILVQLPPHWSCDPDRLAEFLEAAPPENRWTVELRDPSWLCEPVLDLLRAHNAALCIHDLLENHPWEATADWVYIRFHGPRAGEPYTGSYSPQALAAAARRIGEYLAAGRDVYAYFNNDAEGAAVQNAMDLRRYLSAK